RAQILDGLRSRRLDRIGNADDSRHHAVHSDEHHGLAIAAALLRLRGKMAGLQAQALKQAGVSKRNPSALDATNDTLAGQRVEIPRLGEFESPLLRRSNDRGGERMLAGTLQAGRKTQE